MNKELPKSEDLDGIPKENAWIVWLYDNDFRIREMEVYELDKNEPHRWEKIVNRVLGKKLLIKDIGCVSKDWVNWRLQDVLFKLGIQIGFADKEVALECLRRLSRVKEWGEDLREYIDWITDR